MEQRTILRLYFKGPFLFFNPKCDHSVCLFMHFCLDPVCVCVDCRYGTLVNDFLVDDRHCLSEQEVRIHSNPEYYKAPSIESEFTNPRVADLAELLLHHKLTSTSNDY